MIPRIETVKQPVIGKFYMVPCIDHPKVFTGHRFLPVIGPWHEDAEIVEFTAYHFHYDWRFMPEAVISSGHPPSSHARVATHFPLTAHPTKEMPTRYRKIKMKREMIEFPATSYRGEEVKFVKGLEEKFVGHKLKCHTCPHRGMSLDGLPMDDQGRVVCNGHGLRWNLKTGKLAPRLISPAATVASRTQHECKNR